VQGNLAALVVEFFEALEAVASIAHHLPSLADIAELLGQFQQSHLGLDDFLFLHQSAPHRDRREGRRVAPGPVNGAQPSWLLS
jgi:hypothetical protein